MECPNRNFFCYVCGLFVISKYKRNITKSVVESFEGYFVATYIPNLWYVPEVVCDYCYRGLIGWKTSSERHRMKYVQQIIWLPRTEHSPTCCYFCLSIVNTAGVRRSTREGCKYADVESVIPARLRSTQYPNAPSENTLENEQFDVEMLSSIEPVPSTSSYSPTRSELGYSNKPHFVTQSDFNDLVRDAKLSKETAELIGSRLKQWNLVADDFKITSARKRANTISSKSLQK